MKTLVLAKQLESGHVELGIASEMTIDRYEFITALLDYNDGEENTQVYELAYQRGLVYASIYNLRDSYRGYHKPYEEMTNLLYQWLDIVHVLEAYEMPQYSGLPDDVPDLSELEQCNRDNCCGNCKGGK